MTSNFTKARNCWYRECVHHVSLAEHLNRKWHYDKSEDDWCKLFAILQSCWNVNRDKIFMWRVLHHGLYTNKLTSCIGHGDCFCRRAYNDTESVRHIFSDCPYARSTWDTLAKLHWSNASHKNIFQQANNLLYLLELGLQKSIDVQGGDDWMLMTEICIHLWVSRNQVVNSSLDVITQHSCLILQHY